VARLRRVQPDEQLTLVEHLDELRTRIVSVLVVFGVTLGVCFWQYAALTRFLREPIHGAQLLQRTPGEAFLATLSVCIYTSLLITLPLATYQLYAFVIPAFSTEYHRSIRPLLLLIPVLFVAGVVFGWYLVLPPALAFLLHFNEGSFQTLLSAKEYFNFVALTLAAMGIVFELPVVMLVLGRLGLVTSSLMRRQWRLAIVVLAAVAALLPGTDPITMLVEFIPLVVLYGFSYVLVRAAERGRERKQEEGAAAWPSG
jgi:sec-independent protein translocase protein TatC